MTAGAAGDWAAWTGACVAAEDGGNWSATSTGWAGGAGAAGDCAALTGVCVAGGDGEDCSAT